MSDKKKDRSKKTKKLKRWLRDQLNNKWRMGYGKPKEKGVHNETPYIHSENTYISYLRCCNRFADWCKERGITDKDMAFSEVSNYAKYLEEKNYSPWTISTDLNAIAKAYGVSTKEFNYLLPKRERGKVKRSRFAAERDKHFSIKNNYELITFVSCTGLRRHELANLHGDALRKRADGSYFLVGIKGKGGKERTVDLIGTKEEIECVVELMLASKDGLVFTHIHSSFDEHYYRSIYACRAYKFKARDLSTLDSSDKYICRKDKAGIVYDKEAMKYASKQLGHNRIDVIAESYLHNL